MEFELPTLHLNDTFHENVLQNRLVKLFIKAKFMLADMEYF